MQPRLERGKVKYMKDEKKRQSQDTNREGGAGTVPNTRVKDSGAKLIFDNHILCAQFLRGYTDLDILKNVQPEDIEDILERFLWMWQENRDSDSVKKIRLKNVPGNWTAEMNFSDRVFMNDVLGEYIPDFHYIVVPLSRYSDQELVEKGMNFPSSCWWIN